ncbi:hypothetical protein RJD24_12430 [Bacillaceae bacterium IKA-2]|nr:hypothetical protein RJD24_12430 [Bacillaceae bacterium IKA-2]
MKYESDKRIEDYSTSTINNKYFPIYQLTRYFGGVDIRQFNTKSLDNFLLNLNFSISVRITKFIKSLLKWAHEEGYISSNPSANLKDLCRERRIPLIIQM